VVKEYWKPDRAKHRAGDSAVGRKWSQQKERAVNRTEDRLVFGAGLAVVAGGARASTSL
jgi:hypothetical protein